MDIGLFKRLRHTVEHAAREVGGDHLVAGQPERHGKRPGAASHIEHGFPGLDIRQLDETSRVSAGFGAGGEGVGAGIPVGGVIGFATYLLQRHPLRVPIGGGELRDEGLRVDDGFGAGAGRAACFGEAAGHVGAVKGAASCLSGGCRGFGRVVSGHFEHPFYETAWRPIYSLARITIVSDCAPA